MLQHILTRSHEVCQQLQSLTAGAVVICWAEEMEIFIPLLDFLDDSHTHTSHTQQQQPGDDGKTSSMFAEVSAEDISCWTLQILPESTKKGFALL